TFNSTECAAVRLCCVLLCSEAHSHSTEDAITPFNETVHVTEGDNVTLSCNYSGSVTSLLWYRQYPRSAPEFLLLIYRTAETPQRREPRMSTMVQKEKNRVDLELSSTEVTDSAVYYCALRPTVTGNSLTLYKNLTAFEQLMKFFFLITKLCFGTLLENIVDLSDDYYQSF
uniref:T-cell receptor alpha/delta variable 14.0 n=1 Tax=Paramormyrops kingsleyae TaxID=1676925 RepID=A0A3B3Q4G3_9TELE